MAEVEAYLANAKYRGESMVERTQIPEVDRPEFRIPTPHIRASCLTSVPLLLCKTGLTNNAQGGCKGFMSSTIQNAWDRA